MSEAAHVPFTETKAPESAERLHRGALGLIDISASTMANIGPAYSFYFGFGLLVITAGIAAPLIIVAAIIAIALLGNTLSQFSRAHPSTGGFITFVGKTFGGTSAVTTALLCGAGYIIAISSVLVISGGFLSIMLQYYFNVSIPWIIFSRRLHRRRHGHDVPRRGRVDQAGRLLLRLRADGAARRVDRRADQERRPPQHRAVPAHHLTNHFSGLAPAFPLAVYLFIGWENSAALAEETNNPRRNVPRAVFLSIAFMAAHLPAAVLRHGHRLPLQRHGAHRPPHPVHQRRPQRGGLAGLHRLPGRADLHPRRAHRRGELAVPADLQRRPRGPAAALDRPGAPGPPDAGQRHHRLRRHRQRDHPGLGARPPGSAGPATAWTR